MKYTTGPLAIGAILFVSAIGCDYSSEQDLKKDVDAKQNIEHVHSSSCGHAVKHGRDLPTTVSEKLSFLPEVLAVVDGEEILRSKYIDIVKQNIDPSQILQFVSMPKDELKAQAIQFAKSELDRSVMSKLSVEAGYVSNQEDVAKDVDKWISTFSSSKLTEFKDHLLKQGSSIKEYKNGISSDKLQQSRLAVTTWLSEKIYSAVAVSEQDVKKAYDNDLDRKYKSPEQVKVVHIPCRHDNTPDKRSEAESKAKEVHAKLLAGAEFDQMVREYPSSDGHLNRLGVLDFFVKGTYNEAFEKAAFSLGIGELSGVIDTPDGFQLIKVIEIKVSQPTPLSDVKEAIKTQLLNSKKAEAVNKVLSDGIEAFNARVLIFK